MSKPVNTGSSADAACFNHEFVQATPPHLRVYLYAVLLAFDFLAITLIPFLIQHLFIALHTPHEVLITFAIVPFYLVFACHHSAFSLHALQKPWASVRRALTSFAMAQAMLCVAVFYLDTIYSYACVPFALNTLLTAATLACMRWMSGKIILKKFDRNLVNKILIIDGIAPDISTGFARVIYADQAQLEPDINDPAMLHRFGLLAKSCDRMLIAAAPERKADWAQLLKGADIDGEILLTAPNSIGVIGIGQFRGRDTLLVSKKPLCLIKRAQKRALDLAITIPLLVFLMPLMSIIAVLIKLEDGGPILFKQHRVGRGYCLFQMFKFRSMSPQFSDAQGSQSTLPNDQRVTKIGRFIRATSIDELPQLFNVILGNMSLVGPRPHALGSLAGERLFWEVDPTYWHRHQLKPGITGLAQVRGLRGSTQHTTDLTYRLEADMEYVHDWGIWRDFRILALTLRVIVHENAF